ncbi:MAG: AbrB/MazE/SpoVT family DNA-binding domain-containing protein [Syntrophaceae bacterium]|nr:AbrB/MazE/SpoVT family DNA-binding domain-containing protein [Syntrophaceae bacterium]
MKITSKGQVTIPFEVREKMGFFPDTEVEFIISGNNVLLKKVRAPSKRSQNMITLMQGKATVKMTTDEITALTRG